MEVFYLAFCEIFLALFIPLFWQRPMGNVKRVVIFLVFVLPLVSAFDSYGAPEPVVTVDAPQGPFIGENTTIAFTFDNKGPFVLAF